MVFSGNPTGERRRRVTEEEEQEQEEEMDRLKPPLHNFDLPCLKWGNQKFSEKKKLKSKIYSKSVGEGDGDEIEATREKLMFDLQTEVDKMKDAMLRGSFTVPSPSPVTVTTPETETKRPWNLRTRRAACKAPSSSNIDDVKANCDKPPVRYNECEKSTERRKFSVSLSRKEVGEDFAAITGRRLPRKPKKRPRAIQKQLDTLFPGLWLTEITPDLYRVPDDTETGKR